MSAAAASDAWAVGYGTDPSRPSDNSIDIIEHWNGSAWSVSSTCCQGGYPTAWLGVSADSPTDAWAVGYYANNNDLGTSETMAGHWNGSGWSAVSLPYRSGWEPATLRSVVAISPNDAWAVGDAANQGLIEHWDGQQWSIAAQSPQLSLGPSKLYAVSAISSSSVWAVGSYSTKSMFATVIEHFDGKSWNIVKEFPYYGFFAIATSPPDNVYVPGTCCAYNVAIERFDGTSWTLQPGPPFDTSAVVNAASANRLGDALAVGSDASSPAGILATLWDGKSWKPVDGPPNKYSEELFGVSSIPGTNQFWTVGDVLFTPRALIELYHC